jgi:hypothetical protein
MLVKLRYTNKGSTKGQHAPKGNIRSFAQDPENEIQLFKHFTIATRIIE